MLIETNLIPKEMKCLSLDKNKITSLGSSLRSFHLSLQGLRCRVVE